MKSSSILSVLVIAALTASTIAVPLSPVQNSQSETKTIDETVDQVQTSNQDRQGRSWSPFGSASESRRGRFNRDVESTEPNPVESNFVESDSIVSSSVESTETQELIEPEDDVSAPEQVEADERQGRSWSPFGSASESRRGRFNRDVESKSVESNEVLKHEHIKSNERQGRSWSPFADAVSSRRGRFN